MAFVREYTVGACTVNVLAVGHNKTVPLLLVATASLKLPGGDQVKVWKTADADSHTPQPRMHEIYYRWMNLVDFHNKRRQGEGCMTDVGPRTLHVLVGRAAFCQGTGVLASKRVQDAHIFQPKFAWVGALRVLRAPYMSNDADAWKGSVPGRCAGSSVDQDAGGSRGWPPRLIAGWRARANKTAAAT
eukprot:6187215-Pleurochrysis_carterae.AAC.1